MQIEKKRKEYYVKSGTMTELVILSNSLFSIFRKTKVILDSLKNTNVYTRNRYQASVIMDSAIRENKVIRYFIRKIKQNKGKLTWQELTELKRIIPGVKTFIENVKENVENM